MMYEKFGYIWRAALVFVALALALAAPAMAASDGTTTCRALLIGNSVYDDSRMKDLASCAYDLSAMASALQAGSIQYDKVVPKSSLTAQGIQSAVNDVLTWGQDEDDVTVFYYTGHGNSGGLAGVDYNISTGNGAYSFSLLQSALAQVPGKVIVLLDACESGGLIAKGAAAADSFTDGAVQAFSGASAGGLTAKAITGGDHFHVIASSSQSQASYNMDKMYGATTWALCEAMGWSHNGAKAGNKLTSLEGDANSDGTVTIGEAYGYASGVVSELLARYGYAQDMQIYPVGSAQTLIRREAVAAAPAETVKAFPTTVTGVLNLSKACIAPGMKLQLKLNAAADTVSFASSRNAVAIVDSATGLVTGVKSSSSVARISVNYTVGEKWYFTTCDVRVLPARYVVRALRLKRTELTLPQNKGYVMPVRFSPASARYKKLIWASDNKNVAVVSSSGKILAVSSAGTATITATATSGVQASVIVTAVPASPSSVRLNASKVTLIPGGDFSLTATVYPVIAGDKTVTWSTGNSAVATVSGGWVTAGSAAGRKTTITARTVNGKKATCTVYVVANQSTPRTRPRSASGQMVSSARRIYYNAGSLCVDMYFYNRTRYAQKIPMYDPGLVVIKLKDGTKLIPSVPITTTRTVRSGAYTIYSFRLSLLDYPTLVGRDLRGSDAWYEAVN